MRAVVEVFKAFEVMCSYSEAILLVRCLSALVTAAERRFGENRNWEPQTANRMIPKSLLCNLACESTDGFRSADFFKARRTNG